MAAANWFSTMNWSLVAWLLTGAVAEDSMPAWPSCWSWQVAFEIRQPQALALLSGRASLQACCKETCTKWPQPSSSWSSQERLNRRTRVFGSPLPRMDLQTKPAMTPTASVALVVRSCTSTTQTKDRLLADAQHPTYLVGLATQVSTWDEGPPVPGEHPIPAAEWRCTHRAQDGPTQLLSHGKAQDGEAELSQHPCSRDPQQFGLCTEPPPPPAPRLGVPLGARLAPPHPPQCLTQPSQVWACRCLCGHGSQSCEHSSSLQCAGPRLGQARGRLGMLLGLPAPTVPGGTPCWVMGSSMKQTGWPLSGQGSPGHPMLGTAVGGFFSGEFPAPWGQTRYAGPAPSGSVTHHRALPPLTASIGHTFTAVTPCY